MSTIRVIVSIVSPTDRRDVEVAADSSWTLIRVLEVLFREHALSAAYRWQFDLPADQRQVVTVGELFARTGSVEPLRLLLVAQSDLDDAGSPPAAAPGTRSALPAPPAQPQARDASGTLSSEAARRDEAEDEDADEEDEAPRKRKARARGRLDGVSGSAMRRMTERRATVRYYTRMNPDRMFPLLVILSAEEVAEIVKAKVKQTASEKFQVEEGSVVEVEPVLPGCDCYPPRQALTIDADGATSATIWVVPRVLGRIHGARVLIRQGAKVLAEVPLDVKVAKQTLAVACGLMSLAAPYLTMGLKSLKLDYASQKDEGFPLYQQAGNWVAENLRPEWLGLGFLGLAFLLYLWMRRAAATCSGTSTRSRSGRVFEARPTSTPSSPRRSTARTPSGSCAARP